MRNRSLGYHQGMRRQGFSRQVGSHKRAHAPQDEGDESLRGASVSLIGFLVHVKLTGNEQEIVAHPVQKYRTKNKRRLQGRRRIDTLRQQEIPGRPRQNPDEDRLLVAKPLQHHGEQKQKNDIRNLGQREFAGEIRPLQFGEVNSDHHEVEIERDTNEEHTADEDRERRLLHQREGIEPQYLRESDVLSDLARRGVRQQQREEPKEDRE